MPQKTCNKQLHMFRKFLLPAGVLLILLVLLLFNDTVQTIHHRTQEEQLKTLSDALRRASIQCYAIEGRYPPSAEYLEQHYSIFIDRQKYHVFYDGWASNVMPEITVIPAVYTDSREVQP